MEALQPQSSKRWISSTSRQVGAIVDMGSMLTSRRFSPQFLNPRSTRLSVGCFLVLAICLLVRSHHYSFESALHLPGGTLSHLGHGAISLVTGTPSTPRWKAEDHHALIYTSVSYHEDVWLYLIGTLTKMGVDVDAYTEYPEQNRRFKTLEGVSTGVRFNLMDVANQTGMLTKPLKERSKFLDAVNTPTEEGQYADVIFLPTEIQDMQNMASALLEKWHERPANQKFRLVVMAHSPSDGFRNHARQWAKLGALTYLTLSQHVATYVEKHLRQLARSRELSQFGLENVKVKIATPFLPAQALVEPSESEGSQAEHRDHHNLLSRAIIAGKLEKERRDYMSILTDLQKHLQFDAHAWGYRWNNEAQGWLPIDKKNHNTFRILLFGEHANWDNPLNDTRSLVEIRHGESQITFYQHMATTDVMLRAWWTDSYYYDSICSGAVVRSIETATPMMVTPEILTEYTFLDHNTAIVRPDAISDIDAIALFRRFPDAAWRGVDDEKLVQAMIDYELDDAHSGLFEEIKTMLERGWKRTTEEFDIRRRHVDETSRRGLVEAILGV